MAIHRFVPTRRTRTGAVAVGVALPARGEPRHGPVEITGGSLRFPTPTDAGWAASVILNALTPPADTAVVANTIGCMVDGIAKVGTATHTAPAELGGVSAKMTATRITGDNSATWTPTINVAVAGGMGAGCTPPRPSTRCCDRCRRPTSGRPC